MSTECNVREFDSQGLGSRAVTTRFDGGAITSDAGGLLLREVEARHGHGAGSLRHDPLEVAEVGSTGADHGLSGVDFAIGKLSVLTRVCPGV